MYKKNINQKLFFLDDSFLSNNEISKNPFYQEFLREFGVKRIHNAIFRLDSGERFLFSIQEALDEKEENQNEIANKFKTLTPHIIQALSLSIKFHNLQNECAVSKKVFNHLGCFFVFLDEKNQFIYTNVSVYDLEQKGIRIKENKVYIENLKYRNSFKSLLNSDEEFRFFSFYHNEEKINSRIINLPKQYNFLGEDHKNSKKVIIFSPAMVNYNTENILKELFLSPKQAQLGHVDKRPRSR
ncbi:hypothetical protein [Acetobacter malorum]|uniref:hypothetical protein n=1 Tax=Acetobacter malorum TaxID=178901 RepID=UPI0018D4104F|nr:hypothetical protein [Acetobacter malorum]